MDNYYDEGFGGKVNHMRDKLNEHWDIQGFINIKVKKLSKVSHSRSNTTVNIVK